MGALPQPQIARRTNSAATFVCATFAPCGANDAFAGGGAYGPAPAARGLAQETDD
jgi:hypothetical protein